MFLQIQQDSATTSQRNASVCRVSHKHATSTCFQLEHTVLLHVQALQQKRHLEEMIIVNMPRFSMESRRVVVLKTLGYSVKQIKTRRVL